MPISSSISKLPNICSALWISSRRPYFPTVGNASISFRTISRSTLRKRTTAQLSPSSAGNNEFPLKSYINRLKGTSSPQISNIVWAATGAFLAMTGFALLDNFFASRGLSMALGSFGAVCTLLFALPSAPVSQKWNVLVGHLICSFVAVAVFLFVRPIWLAKAVGVSLSVALMQFTDSLHPPAAGLPLIFIEGAKWHSLKWWYVLFPGFVGCLFLFLLQLLVEWLKRNYKF